MESKTILAGLLIGLMIGVFTGLTYAPILDITGQFTRLKKQIDTLQSQIETL